MIEYIDVAINNEDLIGLDDKINNVLPLNKFDDPPIWSSDLIYADKVYRIQKFVQRVVEETGTNIHESVIKHFGLKDKIYPYRMQLIYVDRDYVDTDIVIEDQICQTITPLKNNSKTFVIFNNNGRVSIPEIEIGSYAIASYWTFYRDPGYKNWFLGKYLKYYG